MPELPEVETTRRSLAPVMEGRAIERVEVRRPRMARRNARPEDVEERLLGRRILELGRLGKFMVGRVEDDLTLLMHLGMSGRMQIADASDPETPHTNVVLGFTGGREVRFVDPRTFGFVAVHTPDEPTGLDSIGRDALTDLPPIESFVAAWSGRIVAVKAALLDQRFVAGLGNIYADEVLHRAQVHPLHPIGRLGRDRISRIQGAIVPVLEEGLRFGGTSLDDLAYLLPDGRAGEYVGRLSAYGRVGEPCRRCGTPIEKVVVAQRASHFCPRCQRMPD